MYIICPYSIKLEDVILEVLYFIYTHPMRIAIPNI